MDAIRSLLSSDPAEQARAEALAARDVVERLEAMCEYRPDSSEWNGKPAYKPEPSPGLPYSLQGVDIKAIRNNDELLKMLAAQRELVTAIEGRNAARLRTLLWAIRILGREGEQRDAERIRGWTKDRYRIGGSLVTEGARERRRFAERMTRDYAALPMAWRDV